MDDFAFPWDQPPPKPKSAATAKARRSSILKGSSAPPTAGTSASSSERSALQEINNVNVAKGEAAASKKMSRRSSKRVSFSASKIVKEFEVGSVGTVWNTTYEEEHGQSTLQSTSSASGGAESLDENRPADMPDGASRKRRILHPETSDEVSPSKQTPLRLEIPAKSNADGDDSGNPYLPWGEKGGEDLMLESPLVNQPRNTFLSSLAPAAGGGGSDLDKSTFQFDANDVSSASDMEVSAVSGANKTTRSDLDMDETRAVGPTLCNQSKRFASDRTMLFNKTGADLLDVTSCVEQNEGARDVSEMNESNGDLSLTTAVNPSSFLNSLGKTTTVGSVSSMESTLIERDDEHPRSQEEPMEITRAIRQDPMPASTDDKTMLALDEGMDMTVAVPSKKSDQNQTPMDAASDREVTSQELEFTRAALFSHRSTTITTGSVSRMEPTLNGTNEGDKSPYEESMEMTRVVRPNLMTKNTENKPLVADERMEMTLAQPSQKLAENKILMDSSCVKESTSQALEVTRPSLFSQSSNDVTPDVIETLIASDNGKKLKKPASDETLAGMDEGMELTAAIPPAARAQVVENVTRDEKDEEDDDEVTFNAASILPNATSSAPLEISSNDNVNYGDRERSEAKNDSSISSNDECEEGGVFKEPMEFTKSITKDFRKKLAERSKSNSSGDDPDDDSILPESFLESKDTENDSVFLHSGLPIHGAGKTNLDSLPRGEEAAPEKSSPALEELLNPTTIDFSCIPGYQG